MSVINNPSMVQNGLLFYMDAGNAKSVSAPTTKNIATQITPRGQGSSATYNFSSGTENVYIPTVGWVNSAYMDMYNDYNGGSGNCCPSPYGYGDGITVTGSTQYTYAILYKSVNRHYGANYMYHYEYTSGGSYLTEYGVHMVGGYSGQETHLGDDWYWSRSLFTTNASVGYINTGAWMYQYATYNRLYIAKVLIAPGNWTNLHPANWPALNTVSTAVNDISGANNHASIVNASQSITTTPNAITLNGTNQYIRTNHTNYSSAWSPNAVNGNSAMTIEVVFKSSDEGLIVSREWNGSGQYNYSMSALTFGLHVNASGASLSYSSVCTGANVHMVWWMDATQFGVYRNGEVYVAATNHGLSGSGGSAGSQSGGTTFGTLYPYGEGWGGISSFSIAGDYYIARIYNRVLSAGEIRQNFNATRRRFGL
jgi:hypothetical protein